MDTAAPRLLLRVEEAAESLGLSRATVYELITAGEIPSVSVGRARRVPVEALQRWISNKLQASCAA